MKKRVLHTEEALARRVEDAHMPGPAGWDSGSFALKSAEQSGANRFRLSNNDGQARPTWTELRTWTDPEKMWGCRAKRTIRVNKGVRFQSYNPNGPTQRVGGFHAGGDGQTWGFSPTKGPQNTQRGHIAAGDGSDSGLEYRRSQSGGPIARLTAQVIAQPIAQPTARPTAQPIVGDGISTNPTASLPPSSQVHPTLSYLPLNVFLGETVRQPRIPVSGSNGRLDVKGETGAQADAAPMKKSRMRRARTGLFKSILWLCLLLLFATTVIGIRHVSKLNNELPVLPANPAASLPQTSLILANDGTQIGTLYGDRRTWIGLEDMSSDVISALIAAEDHRFYEHDGIDFYRIAGAFWNTVKGDPEGASTIPMQLARNFFPELKQHSLVDRKIQELILARRIDQTFSKDETLEWYLNTVAFGHNSFGIEAAAERFYATGATSLTLAQASLLVGMLQGPSRYDPFSRPDNARGRRDVVLTRMAQLGFITEAESKDARAESISLEPVFFDPAESIAPHFLDFVKREATDWANRAGFDLRSDGLVIHTSIDPTLQRIATESVLEQTADLQSIISREFGAPGSVANERFWRMRRNVEDDYIRKTEPFRVLKEAGRTDQDALISIRRDAAFMRSVRDRASQLQAGFVAMDPHSGQIKAWVGGTDYREDQFDKVASARRQPGSVFKPILYAEALERGYSPYYMVEDRIKTFSTNTRGEQWTPTNSGGGASGRLVTLRQGLAWSKNTVSAHLISRIGPQAVVDRAEAMGITSSLMPVPSLALGTSETSLLEMVNVYATLAENGVRRNVTAITSISDRDGNIIATFPSEPDRVLSEQTSHTMIQMMRDVVDGGTGGQIRSRFAVKGEIAGKTGTTQNNADGWFIAIHPDLVVGAWVGFNDQRITFQSDYWGQGGHNALLLVGDFLREAGKGPGALLKPSRFSVPKGYRTPVPPVYSNPSTKLTGPENGTILIDDENTAPALRTPVTIPSSRRPIGLRTRFVPTPSRSDS